MVSLGAYIHYPWCRYRCPYCDFPVAVDEPDAIPHEAYADALIAELSLRAADYSGQLASIYIGGGTPSIWQVAQLARVIAAVRQRFPSDSPEITVEANPIDCTSLRMQAWRAAGVNRLSIGVQSFEPRELVTLGRDHRMGDGADALQRALAAGFDSVSADLILGVPGGGRPGVACADAAAPEHVSIYELTIEERTPFHGRVARGELVPKDDDELADLYLETHEFLTAHGYQHYEVSSYAKPGHRSRHNSLYWSGAPYLGLGMGAASLRYASDGSGKRSQNPRRVSEYMANPGRPAVVDEVPSAEMRRDLVWLGLRASEGVPEAAFRGCSELLQELLSHGLVETRAGRICPTIKGFLHHDGVSRLVVAKWR